MRKIVRENFENALSKAMLEEILSNRKVKFVLIEIATLLQSHVLNRAIKEIEEPHMKGVLSSWALQHSGNDRYLGALLPDILRETLRDTSEGRSMLLSAMEEAFSVENIKHLRTLHDVMSLLKTLDSMGYYYASDAYAKVNPAEYEQIRKMILPTVEEYDMRCERDEKALAITYGISTELNENLTLETGEEVACDSGKARFFIPPAEERFQRLVDQFDQADSPDKKSALARKLESYGIDEDKNQRDAMHVYAKRHTPWFQKLAREQGSLESLPLIAGASFSTARGLITLLSLHAFQSNGKFDLEKAQIYANCLMGYFVFSGHHSVVEVMEIWNRVLDYVAIYHPDQLPDSAPYQYFEEALPYGWIGDYKHFLHEDYADEVIMTAEKNKNNQEAWLPLTEYVVGPSIFGRRLSKIELDDRYDNNHEIGPKRGRCS